MWMLPAVFVRGLKGELSKESDTWPAGLNKRPRFSPVSTQSTAHGSNLNSSLDKPAVEEVLLTNGDSMTVSDGTANLAAQRRSFPFDFEYYIYTYRKYRCKYSRNSSMDSISYPLQTSSSDVQHLLTTWRSSSRMILGLVSQALD